MKRPINRVLLIAGGTCAVAFVIVYSIREGREDRAQGELLPAKPSPVDINAGNRLVGEPADSSLIHVVLNPVPPLDHHQLIHRIDNLPASLTESESMAICRALRNGLSGFKTLEPGQRHHIANQLMDVLLRQQAQGEWLAAELVAIWRTRKVEETIRDYALQHLAQLMEGRGPGQHLPSWRAQGLPALMEAAKDTATRSAGTALIALHFLSAPYGQDQGSSIPITEFDVLVDSVAGSLTAHPSARAAAFQVAAARTRGTLVAAARTVAADRTSHSGVRLGAINYLSACGHDADVALMATIEAENDVRYRTASRSARERLLSK